MLRASLWVPPFYFYRIASLKFPLYGLEGSTPLHINVLVLVFFLRIKCMIYALSMRADCLLEIGMAGRSLNAIAFILQPERQSLSFLLLTLWASARGWPERTIGWICIPTPVPSSPLVSQAKEEKRILSGDQSKIFLIIFLKWFHDGCDTLISRRCNIPLHFLTTRVEKRKRFTSPRCKLGLHGFCDRYFLPTIRYLCRDISLSGGNGIDSRYLG